MTGAGWRWALGPLALIVAVSIWLAPMLIAAEHDPALARYRDEILFKQTVNRYADPWHHREPFWYFIIEVIPALWLPLTALLPWLVPRWRESFRKFDLRVVLPLTWVVLVVLFFSLSGGKRGVYVLPAVPALALACAPWLSEIARRRSAQRTLFGIACTIAAITLAGAVFLLTNAHERNKVIDSYEIDPLAPLILIGVIAALACIVARPVRGFAAYGMTIIGSLLVVSFWVNPVMNDVRSGADFMRTVQSMTADVRELGLVAYKEQYLLYLDRPVTTFGHARWREAEQEASDAAAWLAAAPGRVLLVDKFARAKCFANATARPVGTANRIEWSLVSGPADLACVAKGQLSAALYYERGK
jgi:4-amino-4-deoxy-L-arabinose transferase-like glycosyltransferase